MKFNSLVGTVGMAVAMSATSAMSADWSTSNFEYRRGSSYNDNGSTGPLVVSCGNQRRQSVVVVAPCGHVGKSQSGLSTCPCGLVVHELEAVS